MRASAISMSLDGVVSVRFVNACRSTKTRCGLPKYSTLKRSPPCRARSSRSFPLIWLELRERKRWPLFLQQLDQREHLCSPRAVQVLEVLLYRTTGLVLEELDAPTLGHYL